MNITAFIIINLLLFSSWYAFLFNKKDHLLFADRLLGAFILGLAQIIATEMLLGVVFEMLYPLQLFLLNMFISAGIFALSLRNGIRGMSGEIREESSRIVSIVRGDLILTCISSMFFITLLWLVFLGYLFPSYTWDALYYHLPIIGQIMQSGAIQEHRIPSFIQQYINIFSKNINLFFLWNVIFLKSDVIVDLGQLPFALGGVIAVYSMAVKLGIREKYAMYSALLFFFAPVIILQSTANYVDCAVSMLFIIAVNFLVRGGMEGARSIKDRRLPVLLSGLAAGILMGSKPTGPLFIAVMASVILCRELSRRFRTFETGPGHSLKEVLMLYLVWFIVPVILTGGYWYARNWIFYGNPVYYMDVSLFGIPLFKGLKSDWVEPAPAVIDGLNYLTGLFHVWLERVGYYMYDSRLSGFGPVWFILFLPSMAVSLLCGAVRKRPGFLFICAVLLITFVVHPRNWTTRYVIFILGLGAVSFGLVLDQFRTRDTALRVIALMLACYTFLSANSPCVMPGKIKEFLLLPAAERTLSRHKPFNIDIKVRKEYGYWRWIEDNVSEGDTLAYTFESTDLDTSRPFFTAPLWNRGFSNRVVYVKEDTYGKWLDELNNINASYILVKNGSDEDRWIERERNVYYSLRWMGNMHEKFRVVYSDEDYRMIEFRRVEG